MPFTHKIPQNVTQYESKVVGNFTPRQFIYLAIGGVIIMFFFFLPFPGIVQFAAVLIVAPVSILFAIVSFQGRRTDTWIVYFLQAISKPTLRNWQKEAIPPQVLLPSYVVPHHESKEEYKDNSDLEEFLSFWRSKQPVTDYSDDEKEFLQKISILSHATDYPQGKKPPSQSLAQERAAQTQQANSQPPQNTHSPAQQMNEKNE